MSFIVRALVASLLSTLLLGCETMNSQFSCKTTAGDSCLTIEQVEAMTQFANERGRPVKARRLSARANNETPIWLNPTTRTA